MMSDITIGQYFPGNSLLHRLDPRMKLILTLLYIIAVFIPQNWFGLAAVVAFFVFSAGVSRLPLKLIFKSIKGIIPLILFTSVLNIFYISEGRVLLDWWIFTITAKGVFTAIFISVRVLCLIAGSSLLMYTTTPTSLTDALERLMKPLKLLRVNVHEIAMMMTIALRFIPTLVEETDKIMSAQKSRGADMESGGILQRIKALLPVLIPLFISSFRRAYELATAMECRCYHGGEGRTRMKQLHLHTRDMLALLVLAAVMAGMIVLNVFIPAVI